MGSEPKKQTQIGKVLKKKHDWASLVAQTEKNLPAVWETRVQSLGWEDPLEKGKATHSRILACRIPMERGPFELQSKGWHRVRHDRAPSFTGGGC